MKPAAVAPFLPPSPQGSHEGLPPTQEQVRPQRHPLIGERSRVGPVSIGKGSLGNTGYCPTTSDAAG
eukprot:3538574-Alexandrium_andersonii.AAC.1